ncbi:MAG: hypothetical protein QXT91_00525 [Candidatus Caldarchaeum sp.]
MTQVDIQSLAKLLAKLWAQALEDLDLPEDLLWARVSPSPQVVVSGQDCPNPWVLVWMPRAVVTLVPSRRALSKLDQALLCLDPETVQVWARFLEAALKAYGLVSFRDIVAGLIDLAQKVREEAQRVHDRAKETIEEARAALNDLAALEVLGGVNQ